MARQALYAQDIPGLMEQACTPDGVLAMITGAIACPADTTEDTLVSIPIPANMLGKRGTLFYDALFTVTGSTNSKTIKVKFGATTYFNAATTTAGNVTCRAQGSISNRGAANSQIGEPSAAAAQAFSNTAVVTGSDDTTTALNFVITGQKATAGETLQLERLLLWYMPGN